MLAILTTHPIQYQVPLWQELARDGRVPFEVWYWTRHAAAKSHDAGFGEAFAWDIDMLSGYPHRFLTVAEGATPNSFWKCRACEPLAERIRAAEVKAIWVQGWQVAGYWQAVYAGKKTATEIWLRGESNDLAPTPFWKRGIKRILLNQLFKRVDHFLYIGAANRRLYEKFGVAPERLHRAPYAVDNERFARQANAIRHQKSEIRSRWGIPEDAFCVLFCGKFIPKKRPLDLVKAAQIAISSGDVPKVHILFVGSGELGNLLRRYCNVIFDQDNPQACGFRPPVADKKPPASFAGFMNQTEISKAYVAADCLVLPSDYGETWGLVVNEALASGLPCIISDQCGCAEDLGRLRGNIVFACGEIGQLGAALQKMGRSIHLEPQAGLPSFSTTVGTVNDLYSRLGERRKTR